MSAWHPPIGLVAVLVVSSLVGRARADEPRDDGQQAHEALEAHEVLSFEALERMIDESPRMRAARSAAEAGEGDVTAASVLQNPVLSLGFAGFLAGEPSNGYTESDVELSQTLPWPGQLDARIRAARARLDADRSLVDVARAYLRLDLLRAYVALVAAEDRERTLLDAEQHLGAVAEVVHARAEAGAGRRWDALRVDAELASLQAARDGAHAEVLEASGVIASMLGRPTLQVRADVTLATLAHVRPTGDAERHPRTIAARRAREAAEAELSSARTQVAPPIDLRLGTTISTGPEGGYLYGGLALPIPIFDQNQGPIRRAEIQARAAQEAEEAELAELEALRAASRRALATREAALARFDAGVTESLETLGEMAEAAFRGGEIDVFELLDSVRAAREVRLERIDREEAVRHAEINLVEAVAP